MKLSLRIISICNDHLFPFKVEQVHIKYLCSFQYEGFLFMFFFLVERERERERERSVRIHWVRRSWLHFILSFGRWLNFLELSQFLDLLL